MLTTLLPLMDLASSMSLEVISPSDTIFSPWTWHSLNKPSSSCINHKRTYFSTRLQSNTKCLFYSKGKETTSKQVTWSGFKSSLAFVSESMRAGGRKESDLEKDSFLCLRYRGLFIQKKKKTHKKFAKAYNIIRTNH